MKIKTAIILCAGFGKRLNPVTLKVPKPLLKINNKSLLSETIELAINIGIKKIKLNTYYLSDKITSYVKTHSYKNNIEIMHDGEEILNTGGGVKNIINKSTEENFIIFNPDTLWNLNYKKIILEMIDYYENNKLNNLLMVVNKAKSFDKRLKGDFTMENHKLNKNKNSEYIFTGFQIINRKIIDKVDEKIFSMNKVWDIQLNNSMLHGYESDQKFVHLTDIKIYNSLLENN